MRGTQFELLESIDRDTSPGKVEGPAAYEIQADS